MIEVPIVEFDTNLASRVGALDSLHDFAVLVSLPNLAMIGNNATRATREMPRVFENRNPGICAYLHLARWGTRSMR